MPTEFNFDQIIDRRGSDSFKWGLYGDRDILPLWVADMDFVSPGAVLDALHQRVDHGVFGYAMAPPQLVATVTRMLAETYGWQVDPSWLVWLPGLVSGLNVTCRAVGRKGDAVMTTTPVYPPFLSAPELSGRKLITVELTCRDQRWGFDFDALERAITPRTRLFVLCHPHNPTGRIFDEKELTQLFDICRRHDILICSDEIHCQLILNSHKKHLPFASLGKEFEEHTITLMAPSKTYNIPGLACAFAVISDRQLRRRFIAAKAGIVPEVNAMGYAAAWAAYEKGGPWLTALLAYLRDNCRRVERAIARMPGLEVTPVEATYLAWINARETGLTNPARFFEQAGVGLSDGKAFGAPGYVRLNFGCPRATLDKALQRMQKALIKK